MKKYKGVISLKIKLDDQLINDGKFNDVYSLDEAFKAIKKKLS